jgi:uncharacterized protein
LAAQVPDSFVEVKRIKGRAAPPLCATFAAPQRALPLGGTGGILRVHSSQTGPHMTLRARISDDLKAAMKARDTVRLSTLRLITAAIKDRDIALRDESTDREMTDTEILATLARMVKMRQDSAKAYEEGGRLELVERELAEIAVIEEYLPRQLDEAETDAAIDATIAELEAVSIRDMGRVMNALKVRYTGQIDFGAVGLRVKARLTGG